MTKLGALGILALVMFAALYQIGGSVLGIIGVTVLLGGGYAWSIHRRVWADCPRCKGDVKSRGSIFTRAWSPRCGRCGATGKVVRLGVRLFRPGLAAQLLQDAGRTNAPTWRG